MSYTLLHEIQDPYNLLNPGKKPRLDYNTYRMMANLINPLIPFREEFFNSFKWCSDTILWTLKNNRLFYRLLLIQNGSDQKRKNIISKLKNSFIELQLGDIFYRAYEDKVLELIEKLDKSGIKLVFFKATNNLPLDSHNLDVLIREEDKDSIESFLQDAGFTKVCFYREPNKILYRFTKNAEDYIAFHLHTKISWHGVEFIDTEEVWRRCYKKTIKNVDVYFPDVNSHALITFAHMFFENAEITLGDILDIASDLYRNGANIETMISWAKNAGWQDIFLRCLYIVLKIYRNTYGIDLLDKTASRFLYGTVPSCVTTFPEEAQLNYKTKVLPFKLDPEFTSLRRRRIIRLGLLGKTLSNSRVFASYMVRGLFKRFSTGSKESRTFIIAVEGIDGSGKTTHSQKLAEDFIKRGKKPIYIWSTGSLPFINLIRRLVSKFVSPKSMSTQAEYPLSNTSKSDFLFFEKLQQNKVFSSFLTMATIMDHEVKLALKILLARSTYDIIILDRFVHDTLINSLYHYKGDLHCFFSRVLLSACPLLLCKPDVILVLYSAPTEIEKRRKNELTLNEIFEKVVIYQQYSRRWEAYLVNSTGDFLETHLKILEIVLKNFYGKTK